MAEKSNLYVIAGPNGAGKTTFAREFLPVYANCRNFINADLIAEGISPLAPEAAAFHAGRLMLREIELHMQRGDDFGFETTLSGRSHLRLFRRLKQGGYAIHLFFLWIPDVSLALLRVRQRVLLGGHDVPEAVLRRRFGRSIGNFFSRYQALADTWNLFDNSGLTPSLIASGKSGRVRVRNATLYNSLVTNRNRS